MEEEIEKHNKEMREKHGNSILLIIPQFLAKTALLHKKELPDFYVSEWLPVSPQK